MKRTLALTAVTLTVALSLSACGDKTQTSASNESGQSGTAPQGMRGTGMPGSGKVAALSGSTAQVQGTDGQTAVSWTSSTTFTKQVTGTLSDVTKGSCVVVMSGSDDDAAATSVRITQASSDGECTGGFGGPGGGQGGPGGNGTRPTDLPSDAPEGAPSAGANGGGRGGFGSIVAGKVTAVTGSGFTVDAVTMGAPGEQSSSAETESKTVTVSSETTYTTTADASASDVKVGVCLTTRGDSDDTGAVKATTIQVAAAVDGECTGGFGGRRPGSNGSSEANQ